MPHQIRHSPRHADACQASRIDIVANDAEINQDGSEWKPIWRHDNELGHDKAQSMQEARAEAEMACEDGTIPLIVFIGDGVSDLPAARQADVLFARRGLRLEEYCIENGIAYAPFDTFADIQRELLAVMDEDRRKTRGKGMPARFNRRANLWRRVSSKSAVSDSPLDLRATAQTDVGLLGSTIRCPLPCQGRAHVPVAGGLL